MILHCNLYEIIYDLYFGLNISEKLVSTGSVGYLIPSLSTKFLFTSKLSKTALLN